MTSKKEEQWTDFTLREAIGVIIRINEGWVVRFFHPDDTDYMLGAHPNGREVCIIETIPIDGPSSPDHLTPNLIAELKQRGRNLAEAYGRYVETFIFK